MFDGATFVPELDRERLTTQFEAVKDLMADGNWRTLQDISDLVQGSIPAISARLRDLRKPRFGGHVVERRRAGDPRNGIFEYRVIMNEGPKQ